MYGMVPFFLEGAMPAFRNITAQKFGRWNVLQWDHVEYATQFWLCRCDCGVEKIVNGSSLKTGRSVSCGCYAVEKTTTHGMEGTPTYTCWAQMKSRCLNPRNNFHARYGGRGIAVCDRWMKFENFFADMGIKPAGLSIERKNNDLGYTPENCEWASHKRQIRNRSNTVRIDGVALSDLAEAAGVPVKKAFNRFRAGFDMQSVLHPGGLPRGRKPARYAANKGD
jgi:hypothetical protein